MVKVKKKDFVEIEYVGKIKGSDQIFDLTDEKLARDNGLYNPNMKYGARIICVGESDLIKSLDDSLVDKDVGKEYKIEIYSKDAFGPRDNKLIRTVPSSVFTRDKINPFPGLQLNVDGMLGTVRSVSGGRVIIDFNHPLAGRDLVYDVKINKIIEDNKLKIESILQNKLNLNKDDYKVIIKENNADIELKGDNKLKEKVKDIIKDLTKIDANFIIMK